MTIANFVRLQRSQDAAIQTKIDFENTCIRRLNVECNCEIPDLAGHRYLNADWVPTTASETCQTLDSLSLSVAPALCVDTLEQAAQGMEKYILERKIGASFDLEPTLDGGIDVFFRSRQGLGELTLRIPLSMEEEHLSILLDAGYDALQDADDVTQYFTENVIRFDIEESSIKINDKWYSPSDSLPSSMEVLIDAFSEIHETGMIAQDNCPAGITDRHGREIVDFNTWAPGAIQSVIFKHVPALKHVMGQVNQQQTLSPR
ncbi:hypothetical protein AB6D11_06245 [Vibrio splendidus]